VSGDDGFTLRCTARALAGVLIGILRQMPEVEPVVRDPGRPQRSDDHEPAFYDALSDNYETAYEQPFLRDLVHEVVQTIKKNLKVDWTEPHRDDVRASMRTALKECCAART